MIARRMAVAARTIPAGMLVLLSTLSTLPGYVPGRGSNGSMLRRNPAAMPVQFRLNDQTGPELANITDTSDPVAAVQASFQTWQDISSAAISFAPLLLTSESSIGGSAVNLVTFADTQTNRDLVGGALAVTRISFNVSSPYNTITRTDLTFNPGFTFSTTLAANTYDIQSVCTHEIGHALGADHSGVLESTMFQATGLQQGHLRSLAPDDIAWAAKLYPKPETSGLFGSISGVVRLNGVNLFGAHVVALDEAGAGIVGTLTNRDGSYSISGLRAGRYTLYAEPLDGPVRQANVGGAYYSGINTAFPSTFLGDPDTPQLLSIAAGQEVSGVDLNINGAGTLMNIEIGGRSTGQTLSGAYAYGGSFTARPGERFNVVLGGSSLNRISSLSQIKLYGAGVRIAAGATLSRLTFNSGLPGVAFLVEILPDAVEGAHSILAGDGATYSLFTGGMVVVGTGGSSTTSTTLSVSTTTSSTTSTTRPTTSTTTSTTTTTRPTTSTTTSTTTTTRPTTSTTTSTTTTTRLTTSTTTSTTTTRLTTSTTTSTTSTTSTTLAAGQPYLLHFPFLYSDENLFTGMALANTSARTANLTITAYNSAGARLSGTGVINPASLVLPAGEQSALIADQIFRFPLHLPQKGWFEVSSDNPGITGFYLIGDFTQQFLDGAEACTAAHTELVLAGITQSPSFGTEISIVNPDPKLPAQATVDLYDESGRLLGSLERTINPLGRIYGAIPSLFGIYNLDLGHLEIHSDRGLAAAMIFGEALRLDGGPAGRLAVLRAQPRFSGAQRFYLPQYVVGGGYSSHLFLSNAGAGPSAVRIALMGADGIPISAPVAGMIAPHSTLTMQPAAFGFSEAGVSSIPGYLRVDADSDAVVGSVTFEDSYGRSFLAGMNAVSSGAGEAYISQVATGIYGYYTGVACVNISEVQAHIQVSVFDAAGRQVAVGRRNLAAGQRFSELLDQLTGFWGAQQGGYIQVLSTQPVVCFGVVGTENALASVPAQIPGR